MSQPPISMRNPLKAAFLAWLVPGLGHYYQGRKGKAFLYAFCILGLYFFGLLMGEGKIVYWRWVNPLVNPEKFCVHYLGQFFVGLAALPALIQGTLQAYGYNPIFGGILAEPTQVVLSGLHPRLGKLVETWHDLHDGGRIAQHPRRLRRLRRACLPGRRRRAGVAPPVIVAGRRGRAQGGGFGMITASSVQVYWLVLPLVAVISVVYAASRHESWPRIWSRSLRLTLGILMLLAIATALLLLINTQV